MSTKSLSRVSNNNSQNERPIPAQPQSITQSSNVPYPPSRGVPWKCTVWMIREDQSCTGCHLNHPKDSLKLKFHQEVVCLALSKHGYIWHKDVTVSAKTVDKFKTKFPRNAFPAKVIKPTAKRVSDDSSSYQISARHIHSSSISNTMIDSTIPTALINNLVWVAAWASGFGRDTSLFPMLGFTGPNPQFRKSKNFRKRRLQVFRPKSSSKLSRCWVMVS